MLFESKINLLKNNRQDQIKCLTFTNNVHIITNKETHEQLFICKRSGRMTENQNKFEGQDQQEHCCCTEIHKEVVNKVYDRMPDDEILYDVADLFKVFGDCTRIKILYALFESEMCVCDIAELLGMSQSAISHQLRVLKQTRLVKYRRDGKTVFYSLADGHIKTIFDQGLEHVLE